jgi:hypothetical protein
MYVSLLYSKSFITEHHWPCALESGQTLKMPLLCDRQRMAEVPSGFVPWQDASVEFVKLVGGFKLEKAFRKVDAAERT